MNLFPAELDAGLAPLLQPRAVAWHCPVRAAQAGGVGALPKSLPNHAVATNLGQADLLYLDSVLVTAGLSFDPERKTPFGWNHNDDVFDPLEVWAARSSPEDKPFNYGHDCADIIGHITACHAENLSGEVIPLDSVQVPDPFNIVTDAVLYKVWAKDELQARMDEILEGLPRGDYFVSMECLFQAFDYALADRSGVQIVQRNAETAHLSKHLRVAKGSGVYEGKRVGRVLRNLSFSGKGLVKNPANPKSVIRSTAEARAEDLLRNVGQTQTQAVETVSAISGERKNVEKTHAGYQTPTQTEKSMNETELKAEVARLTAALAAKDTAALERDLSAAKAALEKSQAEKADLEKALTATREQVKTEVEKVVAQKADAEAKLAAAQKQVADLTEEKTLAARVGQVVAALKWDEDKARKSVEALKGLGDEAFAAHLGVLATAMGPGVVTNNPQAGNTSFPSSLSVTTPQPVTGLPVPTPVTGLGNSQKPVVASTDTGVLDRATTQAGPALATADASNDSLTKQILEYLGVPSSNTTEPNTQK